MIAKEAPDWPKEMADQARKTDFNGEAVLNRMGELIEGQLKQSIKDLTSPALAPSTVAAKGFSKPLIDTGHMLNSTTFKVTR